MLAWAGCVLLASLALTLAARLAEQGCRLQRLPSRWCWFAAMLLSIVLPVGLPLLPGYVELRLPALATTQGPATLGTLTLVAAGTATASRAVASLAATLWPLLSLAALAFLCTGALRVGWHARRWQHTRIEGLDVYVAQAAGPAVFGWWRPRIVLPEWLSREPTRQRSLALAHERAHLLARDPQLLACGLLLLAVMPWNLPLWWQLRRLRCAIEVDCDRRVLGAGGDLLDYCETLIELSQHRAAVHGLMAAVSEPQSFLERRIRIMSSAPFRFSRLAAGTCMGFACCALAAAAAVAPASPPPAPNASSSAAAAAAPTAAARPALPARPARPPAPAHPATPARPPAPPDAAEDTAAVSPEHAAAEAARLEAEEAQERADEAKQEAEEAESGAQEAMREAEQARREADAAASEAQARKHAAETAANALHADGSAAR
jgi:hypothetical protein